MPRPLINKAPIIVTGSAGRIGASFIKEFSKRYPDIPIVGFELLKALYASANEELIPVNVASEESVAQAFMHIKNFYGTKIAGFIHLAAYYSFNDQNFENYQKITIDGTERILKHLQEFEVEQFLFTSSMLAHAPCKVGETINENSPLVAKWAYPKSKILTEKLIHDKKGNIPTVIMRVAGVYDDQCHSIPISQQISRIFEKQLTAQLYSGDITHGSCYMHMEDLVNAMCLAFEKRHSLPKECIMEIGEDKTFSYDYMQRAISKKLFGKEMRTYRVPKWIAKMGAWMLCLIGKSFIKPWMIDLADDHYALNISKAEKLLGFKPKHSVGKEISLMLDKMLENPEKWYKNNQLSIPKHLKSFVNRVKKGKAVNERKNRAA
ncbi:MAG: NAD(P)-dependent oxidoreductase [Chlamydiae bacterium]|nr:NAD(P)-dependent oxidoreductase [Chlamydiota bacterium]